VAEKKRPVKDRSQIDDMRAALRGDLERARSRGAGTLLQPEREAAPEGAVTPEPEPVAAEPAGEVVPEPKPEPVPAKQEPEPAVAAEPEPLAAREPEPEPAVAAEPEPQAAPEPEPEPFSEPERTGLFRSLFRRR
jgi:outer membrane biosynthesis protein TonB